MDEDFEAMYACEAGRVLAYARRHVPRHDAEDVVAETFTVAWRRRDQLPEEPRAWLIGVARNVIRALWRTKARTTPYETLELLADVARDTPETATIGRMELLEALAALSEPEREAILLVNWDGLSSVKAAEVLGCSATALRVRLHRARQRMQAKEVADA
jgi:RNA polymerase sigma-70 factor (ECF subfamily)